MTEDDKPDIGKLYANVDAACREYRELEQAASFASNRATDALNKLNQAQKAMDAALAELRKKAPRSTDWHEQAHPRKRFEVAS